MESPVLIDLTSCVTFTLLPPQYLLPTLPITCRHSDIYIALDCPRPNKPEMLIDFGRGIFAQIHLMY